MNDKMEMNEKRVMTLDDWIRQSPLPRIEARMLLQKAGGYSRVQLITQGAEAIPADIFARLDSLAERRLNGEPIAYIMGGREFYGRWFEVCPDVLIPRPETEHLVEAVIEHLPKNGRVWDLGTGSGAVAVTVALERKDAEVRASDISRQALVVARRNAENLGAAVEFASGSWFDTDKTSSEDKYRFDVIVSNPPYIEKDDSHLNQGDLRFEPQTALTDFADGLTCIRELAQRASEFLKEGGWLLLEHGYNQGGAVRQILSENGFTEIETRQDLAGLDRLTLGVRRHIE